MGQQVTTIAQSVCPVEWARDCDPGAPTGYSPAGRFAIQSVESAPLPPHIATAFVQQSFATSGRT